MTWKKFLLGLAIFIVTIIFIVYANKTFNAPPKDNCSMYSNTRSYNYNYSNNYQYQQGYNNYTSAYQNCKDSYGNTKKIYDNKAFLIITALSLLAIIVGVLVRSVVPISWGLGLAGLVMILYVFTANFDAIGKPYRAVMSGVALAVLIWLAYARLGDKERIEKEDTSSEPSKEPNSNLGNSSIK